MAAGKTPRHAVMSAVRTPVRHAVRSGVANVFDLTHGRIPLPSIVISRIGAATLHGCRDAVMVLPGAWRSRSQSPRGTALSVGGGWDWGRGAGVCMRSIFA